jgi:hypothetical protein
MRLHEHSITPCFFLDKNMIERKLHVSPRLIRVLLDTGPCIIMQTAVLVGEI